MADKKPDNIVWDEKEKKYNASILPYATNISGPVIKIEDVSAFKQRGVHKAQKTFTAKYEELKEEWNHLVDEVELNKLIYSAKYSFEPVIGETYYLYVGRDEKYFLSLIHPSEWKRELIASVRLNSEHKWVSVKED